MNRLSKLGYSLVILLSVLGILELIARKMQAQDSQSIRMQSDPELLWGISADRINDSRYRPNALGLRGPMPPEKQPGRWRMLTLGDSTVFGDLVAWSQIFSTLVGTQLPIDPVVGAIPGYSSLQSLEQLKRLTPLVEPEMVLIAAMWSDAHNSLVPEKDDAALLRHNQALQQNPLLGIAETLAARSALFSLSRATIQNLKGEAIHIGWIRPEIEPPPQPRVALPDYRANLQALVEFSRSHQAMPIFLMLPHPYDDVGKALPRPLPDYRATMQEVGAALQVPVVDAGEWFRSHPCNCQRFFDDIHPNVQGHQEIAQALEASLKALPEFQGSSLNSASP